MIIGAIVMIVTCPVAVEARLGVFPEWARRITWNRPPAAASWERVDQWVRGTVVKSTRAVYVDGYRFRARTRGGVIAVWKRGRGLGGLDTAFSEILRIVRVGPRTFPKSKAFRLLWCGLRPDGCFGVQGLLLDAESNPKPADVVTFPVRSTADEVWTAVGLVGGRLYVLDGVTKNIRRYVDTDDDGLPDTRDTRFQVSVPIFVSRAPLLFSGPIYGFADDKTATAWVITDWRGQAYQDRRGRFVIAPSESTVGSTHRYLYINENIEIGKPWLSPPLVAGMTRVAIRGRTGHELRVQVSRSKTGPWTILARHVVTNPFELARVALDRPLIAGEFARIRDDRQTYSGLPRVVQPKRPILFDAFKSTASEINVRNFMAPIPRRRPFSIEGENLPRIVVATFRQLMPDKRDIPIVINSSNPANISCIAPDTNGCGRIELEDDTGAKLTMIATFHSP